MQVRNLVIGTAMTGLVMSVAVRVLAQGPPQPPPPPPAAGAPPVTGHGGPPQPGQERPEEREPGRFPAQQRPPADPAVVARGRGLYATSCAACHGADARGGQLGGPNLLRSQLVFNDRDGEAILPVVQNGRPGTLMVPIPMSPDDVKAVATFIHTLQAQGSNQGGPPPGDPVVLDILVGDAKVGETFFGAKCASCHSATGDLQGIATKIPDAKTLQNMWVSGGLAGGRRGRPGPGSGAAAGAAPARRVVTAAVTLPSGEKVEGQLVRLDDFLVTVAQADGTARSFRRDGEIPKVEIRDPLTTHRELLAVYTDKDMHDVTAYLATLK